MDAFVRRLALVATLLIAAAPSAVAPTPASAAQGDITTWAGNGNNWSAGDGGQATSASFAYASGVAYRGGYLYIADYSGNRVRRVNISTGVISTFAGTGSAGYWGNGGAATSAALNNPFSLGFDSAGNAYIADTSNAVVRKVTPGGTISTFAGTGTAGYSGDGGSATLARLYAPTGIEVDSSGNVYIGDAGNHTVRKVVPGGTISTVAGTGTAGYNGDGIAATSARLYGPNGVALDRRGNLYITDTSNNRIRKVTPGGTISTYAGTGVAGYTGNGGAATSAQINGPSGIDVDSRGELYFSDEVNHRIRRVDGAGVINRAAGATSTGGFAGDGGSALTATLNSPYGLVIEPDGDVKFADGDNYRVRRIERQAAPGAPTLTSVTPAGPANDNTINVKGTTESGFTVSLYSNSSCSGTAVATGTSTDFASPGLAVTVADNSTTTFYAKATDSFASVSGCSQSSVTYVEDSAAPAGTIGTSPTTPGSGRSPSWSFSAEAGATFQCQLARGGTIISAFAACTSPKSYDLTGQVDGTYTFSVRATDTAGNVGTASTSD
jgi:sugar lactone lactonase YvrE